MFAIISCKGEAFKAKAKKEGGRWLIGGDNPCAWTDLGYQISIVSNDKIYKLKGNRMIFQDYFDDSITYD